jgi:hypothetical protein
MTEIDKLSKEEFLSRCYNYDPTEMLDYKLPTPEEVYENFSKFVAPPSKIDVENF